MSEAAIDASVGVSWMLKAQVTAATDAFFLRPDDYVVPALFFLEVHNAVLIAERRQRVTAAIADQQMFAFAALPIEVEGPPDLARRAAIHDLARTHTLTVYDGAYLELVVRRQIPLASRDGVLLSAAAARGLQVMDLR